MQTLAQHHRVDNMHGGETLPYRVTATFRGYHAQLGWHGIAHVRADGSVAFYPSWRLRGVNIVCERDEVDFWYWCDARGERVAA